MSNDTVKLLRECNAGCKSATNSMEQVLRYLDNEDLKNLIDEYNDKHIKLGDECHQMLNELDEEEKDPDKMAKTFSWISTEVKLMVNDNSQKIAELMIDGCNLGIKSLSKYINQYKNASNESVDLAKRLIKIEQEFMNELLKYL
ncbi:MAG TPA: hypothetical protein GXZ20_04920 [Halanaerobiaceae bacterium]|jgi:hypothetical protein|nr:hypothetical protein [Halanaerobiaceae bacterium]